MKYYVTIYVDTLNDLEGFTHAFLGLTHTHPDELDEQDKKTSNDKLKNADWQDIDKKWYEKIYPTINSYVFGYDKNNNEGFFGFGSATGMVKMAWDKFANDGSIGKVFENNQYLVDPNPNTNSYVNWRIRSASTFSKTNRCVLEISKEQYNTLLENIKKDFEATKQVKPNTKSYVHYDLRYHITNNNCVNWVIKKLSNIGIELIDEDYIIPGNFMDIFNYIQKIHSTFLKFQSIDENLESIKGAKAFRMWARKLLDSMNRFMQSYCVVAENKVQSNRIPNSERFVILIESISLVYLQLDKILQSMLKNIDTKNIKGDFIFVYWDKTARDIKILDKEHDYQAYTKKEFDLSNSAYNFSVCKFAPFIFIPNDKTLSQRLYHKYDYGNVSKQYQIARNEFYQNVLAGIQSDKYWSSSYHKLTKNLSKNEISKVANA
ncbi:hypothetical protein [Helicobacter sp. T3_23-1059]